MCPAVQGIGEWWNTGHTFEGCWEPYPELKRVPKRKVNGVEEEDEGELNVSDIVPVSVGQRKLHPSYSRNP